LFDSSVAGERQAALHAADRALISAGLTWRDVTARLEQADRAAELEQVAELAVAETLALKERVAELEQHAAGAWAAVPIPPSEAARAAAWATTMAAAAGLTAWEHGFLTSLAQWRSAPTAKQRERLEEIVERIRDRTERSPPP
jgi:hypothetical protein